MFHAVIASTRKGLGSQLGQFALSIAIGVAEDDFNALASALLQDNVEGRVYRLAPPARSHGVVAPYTGRRPELTPTSGRGGRGFRVRAGLRPA